MNKTLENPSFIKCFARGAHILTEFGYQPIETIRPGAAIQTTDRGFQPVVWAGSRVVAGMGEFTPIHIPAGALNNEEDLILSPQHRIYVGSHIVELFTGYSEALVPAHHLVGFNGIQRRPVPTVEYFHLLFERHELIFSNGLATESFQPAAAEDGDEESKKVNTELLKLFPELFGKVGERYPAVLPQLKHFEVGALLAALPPQDLVLSLQSP